MILLAAGKGDGREIEDLLSGRSVSRVTTSTEALDSIAEEAPVLLIVDRPSVDDADDLVRRLRADDRPALAAPLVLLTEEGIPDDVSLAPFDEVRYRPVTEGDLAEVVERAETIREYRNAIGRLYDLCQRRAERGVTDPLVESPDLEAARERADELLDDVSAWTDALPALEWSAAATGDRSDAAFGDERPYDDGSTGDERADDGSGTL